MSIDDKLDRPQYPQPHNVRVHKGYNEAMRDYLKSYLHNKYKHKWYKSKQSRRDYNAR